VFEIKICGRGELSEYKKLPEKHGQRILREQKQHRHTVNKKNRDGEKDTDEKK